MAPGEIEAVAAAMAGPPGLTLGTTGAAAASLAKPSARPLAVASVPAMQLRGLEATRLVLPRHLAAERA